MGGEPALKRRPAPQPAVENLDAEIDRIAALTIDRLRALWRETMGRPALGAPSKDLIALKSCSSAPKVWCLVVADPEPAVNRALAAEMRKVYSSCPISALLALMIFPIRSIPICEVSCEHDSITEVAGNGEILIMLSARAPCATASCERAVAFKNGVDPRHIRPQLLRAGGSRAELKNSASS